MPPIQRPPNGGSGGGDEKKSPLERYLEKQKKTREPKPPSSIEARRAASASAPKPSASRAPTPPVSAPTPTPTPTPSASIPDLGQKWEKKAVESGVPVAPQKAEFTTEAAPAATARAADVGSRFVAALVDTTVLLVIRWPITKVIVGALAIVSSSFAENSREAVELLILYALMLLYYGYFYSKKGASPGKMLLGLAIYDEHTGQPLTPGKAFFREAVGKLISAIPFFIGYFVALFRDDRRALHDLLFDTRVVRNITPPRNGNPR